MPVVGTSNGAADTLRKEGPALAVHVCPLKAAREAFQRKRAPEPIVKARAILDTGASASGVDMSVVRRLHLASRDLSVIQTPAGRSCQFQYEIALHIPELELWREMRVFGLHLAPQPCDVLLGRDILALGTLVYSGWKGSFEFCV